MQLVIASLLEASLYVPTPKKAIKTMHTLYYVIAYVPMPEEGGSG